MRKRIASIVLSICLCLTLLPTMALAADPLIDATTDVTLSDTDNDGYYEISSANELIAFANLVAADDDGGKNIKVKLTKDIDMSEAADWKTIVYCGEFDGAGHTISKLKMSETDIEDEYFAGFVYAYGATIKNVYFKDSTATIANTIVSDRDCYTAIIAPIAIMATLENCSVIDCTVTQSGTASNFVYSGGLVGLSAYGLTVKYCSVQGGSITGNNTSSGYAAGLVGGIYDDDYYKDTLITDSFCTTSVSASGDGTQVYAGGLVGSILDDSQKMNVQLANCYISGNVTSSKNAGGFVADACASHLTIKNCAVLSDKVEGSSGCDPFVYGELADINLASSNNSVAPTYTSLSINASTDCNLITYNYNQRKYNSGLCTKTESGGYDWNTEVTHLDADAVSAYKVSDFKSNLHGKLADGTANVTITLSQDGTVKYTAVTDTDGEYNFGKQVLKGEYTLNIAESGYKADPDSVTIGYAENQKKDITRQVISVTSVTLNKSELSMTVGGTETLTATVTPDGAANKTVTWTSDPESVATVDENGVVTATAAGTATITATTEDGGFTATCTVTVSNPSSSGGGGSSSNTTSTTVKNPDGSTTTTVTDKKTGTVTETTKNTDGSTTTIETKKDGTVTETNKTATGTASTTVTDKNGNSTTTVSVSKKDAQSGETITLPVDEVTAGKSENAQEITVNVPSSGATVEIPVKNPTPGTVIVIVDKDGNETVVPTTKQTENGVSITLTEDATIKVIENSKDFSDVKSSDYFDKAVDWASARGITGGNSATTFGPHDSCTRAQLVTFLWRAAGCPEPNATSSFSDVSAEAYYAKAVAWAFENGIVGGYGNGLFGSDDTITREQMAVILYRFAQHTGMDTTQGGMSVREYKDYDSISDYAVEAFQWAVGAGIVQGNDGCLNPTAPCTRAQIVTFLYRLLGE